MAFKRLFRNTLVALLLGAALVALCYFFVDRPVAFFIHGSASGHTPYLKAITFMPTTVQTWVPAALVLLVVRRAWGPWRRCEWTLLAACVSLVLAEQFKESLALVAGRTWPETWVDNNPSLLGDGTYGFFPFHGGPGWTSFPSGHTARTLAAVAAFWVAYPKWRWAWVLAAVPVPAALLGMDYHFVGDVVGGGFVGGIVGTWAAYCCGLYGQQGSSPPTDLPAPSS
jgi:membrane-associated phospholipid phosphatase